MLLYLDYCWWPSVIGAIFYFRSIIWFGTELENDFGAALYFDLLTALACCHSLAVIQSSWSNLIDSFAATMN